MAEYTEREKLLKDLSEIPAYFSSGDIRYGIEIAISKVKEQPTADIVEVVRCGKCKHGDVSCHAKTKDGEETIACYCAIKNKVTDVDYYCPNGERRDI